MPICVRHWLYQGFSRRHLPPLHLIALPSDGALTQEDPLSFQCGTFSVAGLLVNSSFLGITGGLGQKIDLYLQHTQHKQNKARQAKMSDYTEKQMIINSLPLPEDIHGEIKEYVFFDKITSNCRRQKKEIVDTFQNKATTMVNGNFDFDSNPGYYTFSSLTEGNDLHIQLQFCEKCGNYLLYYVHALASPKLDCNCWVYPSCGACVGGGEQP